MGRQLGIGTKAPAAPLHIQLSANSRGGDPTAPQTAVITEWADTQFNQGLGEGTKWSMRVKLLTDDAGVEVASIENHKTNTDDTSRLSSLKVKVSSDGALAPTEVIDITSSAVTVAGSVLSTSSTGGIGYATGAGASITQTGSRADPVTLNTTTGRIVSHTTSLAAGTEVALVLNNTNIGLNDLVLVNAVVAPGLAFFSAKVGEINSGFVTIYLKNESGSSTTDAAYINFAVIKGVAA